IVFNPEVSADAHRQAHVLRSEFVIAASGAVMLRPEGSANPNLPTGEIEILVKAVEILNESKTPPFLIEDDADVTEALRLKYRYLDLRRPRMQRLLKLRHDVTQAVRSFLNREGFVEVETPMLTKSTPEGARDYLVPSRLHPGKFYALPQAPQQFKQLLMVAGFDRYFQIAPCFRDEDSRADRSPGEFYQLDFEMSFVTQEDVFAAIEPVLYGIFEEFRPECAVTPPPFPRIPYGEAMLRYGTDKPDLRNPLAITDVTDVFRGSDFQVFAALVAQGGVVRGLRAPQAGSQPRSFFDRLQQGAREQGAPGLAWIVLGEGEARGPVARFLDADRLAALRSRTGATAGDAVFFVGDRGRAADRLAGAARGKVGDELGLAEKNAFRFCWVTDFPMYERDEETGRIAFSHNPFSMPQGGLEALASQDPLTIKAYQYDIVCNGVELSSGAIRNHRPDIMYKAFAIAGYTQEQVEARFGGMLSAFRFGAPPHGGSAPGIDRIVMLLAGESNLREVIAFPMNQQAQDLMMQAPAAVPPERLKELHIRLELPPDEPERGAGPR
ncbi:MAG: aspartate--tRNA ligase, partial [Candidatus Rokuibacteriota bacterium]